MSCSCREFPIRFALIFLALLSATFSATPSNSQQLVAEPQPQGVSPFLPRIKNDLRLPVALNGYCVVTLRDRRQWLLGSESLQYVFDGKIYWFATSRERVIFAAEPLRYVPALAGNCVVTLVETGARRPGKLELGILHDGRLYFFLSKGEREAFQADPARYADADLANDGQCLVSKIDELRQLPGLSSTTVIIDGLRYQFAGLHQQQTFLDNPSRYGVAAPQRPLPSDFFPDQPATPPQLITSEVDPGAEEPQSELSLADSESLDETADQAMGGYCPVTIREQGIWAEGDPRHATEFDGQVYLMAGEEEKQLFLENPNKYIPALGGDCVVSETIEHRRVPGTIYHASEFEGRLFLFAGSEQRQTFKTDPTAYRNTDLAIDGNCIVSLVDEQRTLSGLSDLLTWYQGKRYYFATPEHQELFQADPESYVNQ